MTYDLEKLFPDGHCREVLQGLGNLTGTLTLGPHDGAFLITGQQ